MRVDERDEAEETLLFSTCRVLFNLLRDHRDIAELLISRGADVNARSEKGITALYLAAEADALNVFELLLKKGADLHAADKKRFTAFHYVVDIQLDFAAILAEADTKEMRHSHFENKLRIVKLLISRGIDVSAQGVEEQTALDLAQNELPEDSPLLAFLWAASPEQEQHQEEGEEAQEEEGDQVLT
uniref:Uncharacterized protein n=1 Tax=Chromera velia CCMP2878 TaxID=1169474 RepID=A0A0G4ID08_9ALVE|eukprot:Cvel_13190.t1-p1 / transcript=Cvel_13190.t1 / gene=Cvel_13190 / organism=Chromera_velia_CCMP2878 / gene_product=Putative ankyrin repeat protein MM_0045, putative / transcript_product=Putative ankyrin repeat protein MM_0045, putative / location=Cvel_scaffold891:59544-60098(-) / protein_length=185 / sequence_SO=supercontig / SO=protein_coding / is_pseudo=false